MWVTVLLIAHIAAGFTGLITGLGALLTRKGGPLHRRFGRLYFWAMTFVAASAVVLAPAFRNIFLLLIAVLAFYSALSGYRVLRRKNPFKTPADALDWSAAAAVTASGTGMVALGLLRPDFIDPSFAIMFVVFGAISIVLGVLDVRAYIYPPARKGSWLLVHIGNMIGSYIAALTAFSATNLHFLPLLVRWFWPTAVLVPVIIYMTRKRAAKMTAVWAAPATP